MQRLHGPGLAGSPVRLEQPTLPVFLRRRVLCLSRHRLVLAKALAFPGLDGVASVQTRHRPRGMGKGSMYTHIASQRRPETPLLLSVVQADNKQKLQVQVTGCAKWCLEIERAVLGT